MTEYLLKYKKEILESFSCWYFLLLKTDLHQKATLKNHQQFVAY